MSIIGRCPNHVVQANKHGVHKSGCLGSGVAVPALPWAMQSSVDGLVPVGPGQRTVCTLSGACTITGLQCVDAWLILQLCGRAGPTGSHGGHGNCLLTSPVPSVTTSTAGGYLDKMKDGDWKRRSCEVITIDGD